MPKRILKDKLKAKAIAREKDQVKKAMIALLNGNVGMDKTRVGNSGQV